MELASFEVSIEGGADFGGGWGRHTGAEMPARHGGVGEGSDEKLLFTLCQTLLTSL